MTSDSWSSFFSSATSLQECTSLDSWDTQLSCSEYSGILCALPQFLFGAPSPSDDIVMGNVSKAASAGASQTFQGQMCDTFNTTKLSACLQPSTSTNTTGDTSSVSNRARANAVSALVIIVLGMVLQGVAKAPRHPLITTFVDNNIDKTKTGFYMGIIITFGIMGPAAAFALGGAFTRMYVTLEETNIGPRHPKMDRSVVARVHHVWRSSLSLFSPAILLPSLVQEI
ncbi:solute carrier organic anion transporter family member 1B1-like [Pomacea canaliculata]|uniref:solute carrier organic anion transporter family member 1B1-like n=1 Tax=Pomacea canaliculata TaxID=400727 RepID=UPI000D729D23|nr:solute carrier organic anion transporter family member 1B1-like [Pomacea canaliculata]XP_025103097.1 solute carrier organic anion transporter family member 1B1-like [Pomacea canaliculata]